MGGKSYDGTLDVWEDVEQTEEWDALILGNGMSINLWEDFTYGSLYEEARASNLLSRADRDLFKALRLENFEQVLRRLSDAIVVGEALGKRRPQEQALHASIQRALAHAVRAVHIEGGEIPVEFLEDISEELRTYRHVFTTSYDLIVYWASAKGPDDPFDGYCDFFWAGGRLAFDESTISLSPNAAVTRLYYLHGALHVVVLGDGTTCKRKADGLSLLDQFGRSFRGDHTARPLIVTEAAAHDKLRSIKSNDYLTYCWDRLDALGCPVVVFGHSLSEQDHHLIDALNNHADRPVAVSLRDTGKRDNKKAQHRVASLLETTKLHFFDAATHPLGSEDLRVKRA